MPKLDAKSAFFGCLIGVVSVALLGAGTHDAPDPQCMPVRFLVLEAKPSESKDGQSQSTLLTVCPWYGKIDRDSLKSRLKLETQEMTIRILEQRREVEPFASLQRGDIISFDSLKVLKAKAGDARVRHLPSGEAELIKP